MSVVTARRCQGFSPSDEVNLINSAALLVLLVGLEPTRWEVVARDFKSPVSANSTTVACLFVSCRSHFQLYKVFCILTRYKIDKILGNVFFCFRSLAFHRDYIIHYSGIFFNSQNRQSSKNFSVSFCVYRYTYVSVYDTLNI